ncbi:uncharacterized protein LOC144119271 [Amblyomma americanum]|uniref:Uncharacterized protein n=1 Tax=Amblyomma americanum TaxID=6943 RepID=A0AAQ4EQ21_AMBAM
MIPLRAGSSYDTSRVEAIDTELYFLVHPAVFGVLTLLACAAVWSSGVAVGPTEMQLNQGLPPHWLPGLWKWLSLQLTQAQAQRDQYYAHVRGAYLDVRVKPPVVRFVVVASAEEKGRYFPPFQCRLMWDPPVGVPEESDPNNRLVTAFWSPIGHRGGFEPLLVTCPVIANNSVPSLVMLLYMGVGSSDWLKPHRVERAAKQPGTLAMCVMPGDDNGASVDARALAEFVAFHGAVGASYYVFYLRSPGTALDFLTALQQRYKRNVTGEVTLRLIVDSEQDDDEAAAACLYELAASSPFEYAVTTSPMEFVVPRQEATLINLLSRNKAVGAMTVLKYSFVGRRQSAEAARRDMVSQAKLLRALHAEPPGLTSRAIVKVGDVVQMGAHGGFSLLAPGRAQVMSPWQVSVHSYAESSSISVDQELAYDDRMLAYGDSISRSVAWRLYLGGYRK